MAIHLSPETETVCRVLQKKLQCTTIRHLREAPLVRNLNINKNQQIQSIFGVGIYGSLILRLLYRNLE